MRRRVGHVLVPAMLLVASTVALGAGFPAILRIPPKHPESPRPVPAASFSHRAHQSFGCFACHPSVFPQAPLGFAHDDMRQGQFCGQCHQGEIAFAIAGATCTRCHAR